VPGVADGNDTVFLGLVGSANYSFWFPARRATRPISTCRLALHSLPTRSGPDNTDLRQWPETTCASRPVLPTIAPRFRSRFAPGRLRPRTIIRRQYRSPA